MKSIIWKEGIIRKDKFQRYNIELDEYDKRQVLNKNAWCSLRFSSLYNYHQYILIIVL